MTIAADRQIEAGQLWEIQHARLFVVDAQGSADGAYPILLRELARSAAFREMIEGHVRGYAKSESAQSNAERGERLHALSTMAQDRQWFELRRDVQQWHGTIEEWKERNS